MDSKTDVIASAHDFPDLAHLRANPQWLRNGLLSKGVCKCGADGREPFAGGYREENEFALRASAAGIKLAVQPWLYVFHHKTKSLTKEERKDFGNAAKRVIEERMGSQPRGAVKTLRTCMVLSRGREGFAEHLKTMLPAL